MVLKEKILGAPGCGKSYTLLQRYNSFIASGFKPEDITLITFRKTSANDLVNLVASQTNVNKKTISQHIGTIHAICWRLLGHPEQICKEDLTKFIKDKSYAGYMQVKKAVDEEDSAFSGNLFDLYAWLRNTNTPAAKAFRYPGYRNILLPSEKIPQFVADYEAFKKSVNKVDFSDMIQHVIDNNLPLDTPVLMIDEFQDLTAQMNQLFNMWSEKCEAVVVAGDPFQSIYGFWGGSPKYFNELNATEVILQETHRLPQQIFDTARTILRFEGMKIPELKAKQGYDKPVKTARYSDTLPAFSSELHLIRCNYQAGAVAIKLALEGKLFGGLHGWTDDEVRLANAINALRTDYNISKEGIIELLSAFPLKLNGYASKYDIKSDIQQKYSKDVSKNLSLIKPAILEAVMSNNPTQKMSKDSKLFTAKICGALDRKPLKLSDTANRRILTIHGSKGLEADAVFLHTAITPRINKAIVIPGDESAAEARVWYVGATRAKEILYIIKDAGKNYKMPEVCEC